eukprot:15439380-Alexandrium_andersonii.AAC.1
MQKRAAAGRKIIVRRRARPAVLRMPRRPEPRPDRTRASVRPPEAGRTDRSQLPPRRGLHDSTQ